MKKSRAAQAGDEPDADRRQRRIGEGDECIAASAHAKEFSHRAEIERPEIHGLPDESSVEAPGAANAKNMDASQDFFAWHRAAWMAGNHRHRESTRHERFGQIGEELRRG